MNAEVTRLRGREATRERILQAARTLFGEHGYEQVTIRMIAAAADANIALVGRYFGSKAGLFGAVLEGEPTISSLFEGDQEGLPRRLAEYAAERMQHPPDSPILRTLERSARHPEVLEVARERLIAAVLQPLEAQLGGGPDARARARMVAAVFLGIGAMRRRVGPEKPTAADVDRLTAVFEVCLAE
ncbi:TetR/AcrR family transcriptional regulator [Nonomuraea turkmeniaca]|uniref:TetR/AcrR family transcriptional regulator n=1 Tax=Nonomuraea turkmeniaca TaxID=103838 RepID=A0A5S4EX46_9ACTN|nr:TetR/AcrR family transcriptional regulator [Nonomuraea turkmeniaca]TMR08244.1 TetR/AcrR family transcriptional regulator [Nonomuraea turkmeniaca]